MIPFAQGMFQVDPNASPDQIKRQRELIAAMMPQYGKARYIGEGIGQLAYGIGSGIKNRRLDRAESAGNASASDLFSRIVNGASGNASGFSVGGYTPPDPNNPSQLGDDAMAALGKPAITTKPESYRNAIASIESAGSGDYSAVGPTHPTMGRALGRYQVMEANIGPWSREVLGREVSPEEFIANPQLQDQIFDGKFGGYVNQFGEQGAAQAWFAGPGGVGKTDRKDVLGTTVGDYGQKFASAMGQSPVTMSTQGQPGMGGADMAQLYEALANPWLNEQQRAAIASMIQQQQTANDPMQALALQKAQLEVDQMRTPEQKKPIEVGGVLLDPDTYQPVYDSRVPDPGFKTLTPQEVQQLGLPPGAYQKGADGKISAIGVGGTTVTVNNQGQQVPSDEALRKKLMEGEGVAWSEYLKAGSTSSGMKQDMALLDQVIELAPQGPVNGRLAQMFPGVSNAAGVFESIIKRVAPSLRVEGSGSQSDVEYNGFLQSLPSLTNRPEANRAISTFLQSKAQINMERAAAIQEYQNGTIDASEARRRIAEIDQRSIMTPELQRLLGGLDAGTAPQGDVGAATPTNDPGFAAFASDPSAAAAAEKYGVTLEEMWEIKRGMK